jgi:hypothetical protein
MTFRKVCLALVATVALGLMPVSAGAAPSDADVPQTLNVTAIVVDQECVGPGGDFVRVTLSGTGTSSSTPRFAWDFENNGSIDTGALARPRVTHIYPDEINVTAELFARNAEGDMDSDLVSFSTLRCE